jgi:fatty acid synthase subunit beta
MIDFIFGVSHTQHWHSLNIRQNRHHYSGVSSLGSGLVSRIQDQYPLGLDVLAWLRDESCTPSAEYLNTAPVSFPLIGLLQLVQLTAVLVGLGCGPEDLPSLFNGLSGHSQGIAVAAAAAEAANWPDFQEAALKAVTVLFWIGARSQQLFFDVSLPDERTRQFEEAGSGTPSPMLSISGLPRGDFEKAISEINGFLPEDCRMAVSLVNEGPVTLLLDSRKAF